MSIHFPYNKYFPGLSVQFFLFKKSTCSRHHQKIIICDFAIQKQKQNKISNSNSKKEFKEANIKGYIFKELCSLYK